MKIQIIAAATLAAFPLLADKVILKSGSFLTGEAGEIRNGMLAFESEDIGHLDIAVASIASLESERTHVIKYNDNTTETMALSVADGEYVVDGRKFDMSGVKDIDPGVETWHGSINVAYESDRGNTYNNTATVLANVNRRWEKDRFNADFGYYYSESGVSKRDKDKTTDRWEIEAQEDHFWSERLYLYGNGRYEEDDIAGLDYRLRLGAGFGYQWLDGSSFDSTGIWSFSQEAGLTWITADYADKDPDADDSYATVRYAHHLKYYPKWNTDVEGFHNLEYYPQINDFNNYLMKADVGFSTKIIMGFDLLAKIEWEYNSTPSVGRKSSDTRYIIGLGYKW